MTDRPDPPDWFVRASDTITSLATQRAYKVERKHEHADHGDAAQSAVGTSILVNVGARLVASAVLRTYLSSGEPHATELRVAAHVLIDRLVRDLMDYADTPKGRADLLRGYPASRKIH